MDGGGVTKEHIKLGGGKGKGWSALARCSGGLLDLHMHELASASIMVPPEGVLLREQVVARFAPLRNGGTVEDEHREVGVEQQNAIRLDG